MTYRVCWWSHNQDHQWSSSLTLPFLDFVIDQIHDKIKLTGAMPTYYDNSTNKKNADDNSTDTITKTLHLTTSEEKIILKQLKKYEFKISHKKLILKWVYPFIISAEQITISDYLYLG